MGLPCLLLLRVVSFFLVLVFSVDFCTVKNYQSSPDSGAGHGMAWISIVLNVIECETQSYPQSTEEYLLHTLLSGLSYTCTACCPWLVGEQVDYEVDFGANLRI